MTDSNTSKTYIVTINYTVDTICTAWGIQARDKQRAEEIAQQALTNQGFTVIAVEAEEAKKQTPASGIIPVPHRNTDEKILWIAA